MGSIYISVRQNTDFSIPKITFIIIFMFLVGGIPKAIEILQISRFESNLTLSNSQLFRIFPLNGRIAWKFLLRPIFADPPAESPSTKNSSFSSNLFDSQSVSFPGRIAIVETFLFHLTFDFSVCFVRWLKLILQFSVHG